MTVGFVKGPSGWIGVVRGSRGPQGDQGIQGIPGISYLAPMCATGPVAPQTYPLKYRVTRACTIQFVQASVTTPPTGSAIVIDVLVNGTTIFPGGVGRPQILAGTDIATGVPPVDIDLVPGDSIQIVAVSVGSTTPGTDLIVHVEAI